MPSTVNLTVACVDAGGLYDTANVVITLTDANDNNPVFAQSTHTLYVNNNTAVGVPLLVVTASDIDSGDNAVVDYSILGDRFYF